MDAVTARDQSLGMARSTGRIAVRRTLLAGVVATLLAGAPPVAAAQLPSSVIESYDAALTDWYVASGPGTISTVSSPKSQGTGAMKVVYDFSASSQLSIAPRRSSSAPELPGLPRSFSLDVHGDESWNVIYLQVRDATGEIFHYHLGNVSFTGWQTLRVEPGRSAPAITLSGNGDKILDLPIQLYKVVVDKNPNATKLKSSVVVDNLVYAYEAWSPLRSSAPTFVPSAGQSTTLRVGPAEAGSVNLRLTDEYARTRTFTGSAAGGGVDLAFAWNGRDGGGTLMKGSIRARLAITRSGATWTYGSPYLAGLPARYENASPGSIVGINSTLTTINTVDRAKSENQARLMEGAWIRMARESFDWNRLEPRQGWYEWAKFDQAVEIARAHNVGLVGRLEYSASWASSAPAGASSATRAYYPPASTATFAAYATAVVNRYKDRVHVWEIWNEENSSAFWKPSPSASGYAALLKAAFAAIKAADPGATVLIGGTVGFDRAFMDGIVAAGAWNSFDALAIHAYVATGPETSMFSTWIQNARAYVDTKGAKPIWITEFGWSTYSGSGSSYVGVSEANQAAYTARAYLRAAVAGVRGIFAFELMEHGTSTTSRLDNYGLIEASGRAKPAYGALRRVAEALDGGTTAGYADPNAATRTTFHAFDSISGWKAATIGGGSASIALSTARHGGTGSLRLNYAFTSTSTGVELLRNTPIPGQPKMISVWAYGDASANPVYLKVADATGETFQASVGALQKGWQRLVLYADGADTNWAHSGGDNDGAFDYPLTVRSISVFRGGIGKLSGTVYFDDLQAETGARVRGVVISRRGGINQALYSLSGSPTVSVPVTGAAAWKIDGATSTPLTVSGGKVSVGLSSTPINVLTAASSDPAVISPNGDGVADSVTFRFIAGDRALYTFQVFRAGQAVRHVTVGASADAGIRTATWDGKLGGLAAAPGNYTLRLAVIGPDGRVSYLLRAVTVQ
jgi:hypothetical protein